MNASATVPTAGSIPTTSGASVDAARPSIDAVVAALADPTRRAALRLTRDGEMSAGDLAREFPSISRPAVSQHLRVLVDAGLMSMRPQGSHRLYRARTEALTPVSAFIDEMWSNRLQDLRRVAEARSRGGR